MIMTTKKNKCSTGCTLALLLVLFTLNDGATAHEMSTSIQVDQYGDTFDCVDINMQPTLQHPLLKNHTIQMAPSSYPIGMGKRSAPGTNTESMLASIRCPPGKIPIRRNHMQKYFMNNETKVLQWRFHDENQVKNEEYTKYFAAYGASMRVHGIQGSLSVYEPEIKLENDPINVATYSLVLMGSPHQTEYIAAGWTIIPTLDKDNHTRFHISWMVENNACLDHSCPGFVQVSSDIALGSRLAPVSIYGGPQYQINIMLFKDPKTGNWWLAFGETLKPIGYWPKSLFKFLDIGEEIAWGGRVLAASSIPSCQMGSGHFPSEGYGKAAYVVDAKIVNENNLLVTPNVKNLLSIGSTPNCYQVSEARVAKGGFDFFFGGPGGCKG